MIEHPPKRGLSLGPGGVQNCLGGRLLTAPLNPKCRAGGVEAGVQPNAMPESTEAECAEGNRLRGRLARMIADGFFDKATKGYGAWSELCRRGKDPGQGERYYKDWTTSSNGSFSFVSMTPGIWRSPK